MQFKLQDLVYFRSKSCNKMKGNPANQNQQNLFKPLLNEFINLNHPLVVLAEKIPWKEIEQEF